MLKMFKRPVVQSTQIVFFNFKSVKLKHEWTTPRGYDTGIKVYSRVNKQNVPLIFPNKHFVKCYLCGPTVYDTTHIGHASSYVRFDIINRILREFFDIKPVIALGITDIDDKIITRAFQRKIDFRTMAKEYELEFFNELEHLNVLPPAFVLRVSEHIPTIIEFILKIIDKGDAYAVDDGSVYFNSPEAQEDSPQGESQSLQPGQKLPSDFALWKGVKPNEPFWDTPWGKGRPGWHIECSAMASKVFGAELDLHGGGIDLQFPHHANEEVQSCSYHGCNQWVNYWLYTGELQISGQKMSKSLKNFIRTSDFMKNYTADNFRMFCFISKYQRALHFDSNAMILPVTICDTISNFLADADAYVRGSWSCGSISESDLLKQLEETDRNVRQYLMNDFDTSMCNIALMELIRNSMKMLSETQEVSSSRSPAAIAAVAQYIRDVFGRFGFRMSSKTSEAYKNNGRLELVMNEVVKFREEVRMEALASKEDVAKRNLLKACDSLRSELEVLGIVIKDRGKDKSQWSISNRGKATADAN